MSDKFARKSEKLNDKSAHEPGEVSSVESAVWESVRLSARTVYEYAIKPELAKLFKPREARETFRKLGIGSLARKDEAMFEAYKV